MKKILAYTIVLAMVLSSFITASAADMRSSSDFYDAAYINYVEAVDTMVAEGIIAGYPDGTFIPARTVKRAEMAKMSSKNRLDSNESRAALISQGYVPCKVCNP